MRRRWSVVSFALNWSRATDFVAPFSYTRFLTGKLISGEHEYAMGSDFGHTLWLSPFN